MEIIKDREIVEDSFTHLRDDEAIPASGDITVSSARWQTQRSVLLERGGHVGVRLAPADDPDVLVADLAHLNLVVIEFPKFTDGRGYSKARLLRDRHGYSGELRATGNVLRDQLFYMQRCGIEAFELSPGKSLVDALEGLTDFSASYQAGADDERPLYRRGLR